MDWERLSRLQINQSTLVGLSYGTSVLVVIVLCLIRKKSLTTEQRKVVDLAAEKLTKEQQQKFQKRQVNVHPRCDSPTSSWGEGPSRPKGKTIDPQEWGNVNFSQESLNVDAQAAAWDSLNKQHTSTKHPKENNHRKSEDKAKLTGRKKTRHHKWQASKKNFTFSECPVETQPAAQIATPSLYNHTVLVASAMEIAPSYWGGASLDGLSISGDSIGTRPWVAPPALVQVLKS